MYKILIIDSNVDTLHMLKKILAGIFDVSTLSKFGSVSQIVSIQPDMILFAMDADSTRLGELRDKLQEAEETAGIPIVRFSGNPNNIKNATRSTPVFSLMNRQHTRTLAESMTPNLN